MSRALWAIAAGTVIVAVEAVAWAKRKAGR